MLKADDASKTLLAEQVLKNHKKKWKEHTKRTLNKENDWDHTTNVILEYRAYLVK